MYNLLAKLPTKNLDDLDPTKGWQSIGYGRPHYREHLICTFKALNFDYTSVLYIVFLAREIGDLIAVCDYLANMTLEARHAKWFRDAVLFYGRHVVIHHTKQSATTIDKPGRCSFESITGSLPEFTLLHQCLSAKNKTRVLVYFLCARESASVALNEQCQAMQSSVSHLEMSWLWDTAEDGPSLHNRFHMENHVDSAQRITLLQKDFTRLEPQSSTGYTQEEIKAYLRSFDGDDVGQVTGDVFNEIFQPGGAHDNNEEAKSETLELLYILGDYIASIDSDQDSIDFDTDLF